MALHQHGPRRGKQGARKTGRAFGLQTSTAARARRPARRVTSRPVPTRGRRFKRKI